MKTFIIVVFLISTVNVFGKTSKDAKEHSAQKVREAIEHTKRMQIEKERIVREAQRENKKEDEKSDGIYKSEFKYADEDKIKRGWPGGKHGFKASNLEYAAGEINSTRAPLIAYISDCKRFPLNLEDAYRPINNAPKGCEPLKPWDYGIETPWIDPWGRSYQIRYHKERRKLQLRSQGRKLDDTSDDIVRETVWGNAAITFNKEIEKCKKLSNDDKSCVFNRGWH